MGDEIVIEVVSPPTYRPPTEPGPGAPPDTREDWEDLWRMTRQGLKERGLCAWCDPTDEDWPLDRCLMLLPGEWYQHVPDGFHTVNIFGVSSFFEKGDTDDDLRYGYLSFGVLAQPEAR